MGTPRPAPLPFPFAPPAAAKADAVALVVPALASAAGLLLDSGDPSGAGVLLAPAIAILERRQCGQGGIDLESKGRPTVVALIEVDQQSGPY